MEENKKSNKGWIIALAILSILAIGANALQFFTNKPESTEPIKEQTNDDLVDEAVSDTESLIANLENERDMAVNHIDSLEMELSYWKSEIDRVKQQSSSGNISNNERNKLLGQISNLRRRIASFAYKEQLLDSLTQRNLSYELSDARRMDSLNQLLGKVDSLSAAVNSLNDVKSDLENKISGAGKPVYSPLKVYGIDKKKSASRTTFDASKVESIFVEYRLIGNTLYEGNLKVDLKIRVTGPSGELYLRGGDIIEKSRQEDFTWLEEHTYSGSSKSFKYNFMPSKKLPKGKYMVELYENNQSVQKTNFTLY